MSFTTEHVRQVAAALPEGTWTNLDIWLGGVIVRGNLTQADRRPLILSILRTAEKLGLIAEPPSPLPRVQPGDTFQYKGKHWTIMQARSPGPGYEDEVLVDAYALAAGSVRDLDNFESELLHILIEQGATDFLRPVYEPVPVE